MMARAWGRFATRMADAVTFSVTKGKPPVLPDGGSVLWSLFLDLCGGRQMHATGPQPLTASEIEVQARLSGHALQPRHHAVLRAMDRAWIKAATRRAPEGVKTMHRVSDAALTPALFDLKF